MNYNPTEPLLLADVHATHGDQQYAAQYQYYAPDPAQGQQANQLNEQGQGQQANQVNEPAQVPQANQMPTAGDTLKWLVAGGTALGVFRFEGHIWTMHDMNIANGTDAGSTLHLGLMWFVGALGWGVIKCLIGR